MLKTSVFSAVLRLGRMSVYMVQHKVKVLSIRIDLVPAQRLVYFDHMRSPFRDDRLHFAEIRIHAVSGSRQHTSTNGGAPMVERFPDAMPARAATQPIAFVLSNWLFICR